MRDKLDLLKTKPGQGWSLNAPYKGMKRKAKTVYYEIEDDVLTVWWPDALTGEIYGWRCQMIVRSWAAYLHTLGREGLTLVQVSAPPRQPPKPTSGRIRKQSIKDIVKALITT